MNNNNSLLLKNAPLKEVIFELRWELDFIPLQKTFVDSGFQEAVINFQNAIHKDFKEFQILYPGDLVLNPSNQKVTHRFYKEKGQHPLYQIGPGVFTVNDNNKNYSWSDFKSLILLGTHYLKESYNKELVPSNVELRYIDAVDWTIFGDSNKFNFLKEHLNINAEPYSFVDGELVDISFSKRFVADENAYLNITVATGKDKNSNEELVVWHTYYNNKERIAWSNLENWIEQAHDGCSKTFKKMVNKTLYEYFSREH
jgi:uncharacterized protein (TIGR04255 family)